MSITSFNIPGGGVVRLIRFMSPFTDDSTISSAALEQAIRCSPWELNNTVFEYVLQVSQPHAEHIMMQQKGSVLQYVKFPIFYVPTSSEKFQEAIGQLAKNSQLVYAQASKLRQEDAALALAGNALVQIRWVVGLGDLLNYLHVHLPRYDPLPSITALCWSLFHLALEAVPVPMEAFQIVSGIAPIVIPAVLESTPPQDTPKSDSDNIADI